ncbi:MAG TPA: Stf0 family sulfotransferase [Baekduia sp.]|nr:Stf0 family sulfotransferase [Baekduia sp.]
MPGSPPRLAYLVCATPRSGSTLLCETLRATGVAGVPLEHFEVLRHSGRPRQPREYFEGGPGAAVELLPALAPPRPDPEPSEAWWARIRRAGSTPNGVWGGKLMWSHVPDFLARVRELDGLDGCDLDHALRILLGDDLLLVHVRRPDTVDQAVSLWRAVQTQAWRAGADGDGGAHARYAFAAIDHLVAQLQEQETAWGAWLRATALRSLELTYDELAGDAPEAVGRVLRALGLPADHVPAPATRRQGDARSAAWAARYRRDRAAHP